MLDAHFGSPSPFPLARFSPTLAIVTGGYFRKQTSKGLFPPCSGVGKAF